MSGEGEATRADWLVMCYRDKQLLDIMRSGKIDIMEANEDFHEVRVSIVKVSSLPTNVKNKLHEHGIGVNPFVEVQDITQKTVENILYIREMLDGEYGSGKNKNKKKKTKTHTVYEDFIGMLQGREERDPPQENYQEELELSSALKHVIEAGHDFSASMLHLNGLVSVVHVTHFWIDV